MSALKVTLLSRTLNADVRVCCTSRAHDIQGLASAPGGACGLLRDYVHDGVHLKYSDLYNSDAGSLIAVTVYDDQSDDSIGPR
eukprot:COSAG02_NODE_35113_length_473_cov_1.443850_2_plen_83_part_00